ncbi:MAG: TatD family hydrolase [Candidatus Bathyarchaeia archaeon]|nr:TatD family hydrolase [Candidatus Bathyarchaeota archaeon]
MEFHLFDTHAHLEWSDFDLDRCEVIRRAVGRGVKGIVNVGYNLESSLKALELARSNTGIYAAVGIHPHEAYSVNPDALGFLEDLSRDPKVVAIGEIGLDYYRGLSPRGLQISAFKAQLELAYALNLPVIIHCREAHNDLLEILRGYKAEIRGIMHCFSGSYETAKQCMALNFYISFAGPVTYPNAKRLERIVYNMPMERLLIETDSPWLAPQPVRGRRNEPSHIVYIAERIAEIKDTSIRDVADSTTRNAEAILGLTTPQG